MKIERSAIVLSLLAGGFCGCSRPSPPGGPATSAGISLPREVPPFAGKIGTTYQDSTPDFPKPVTAPKGAPNVLLILTDDTGFGHAATFGGAAATPTLDRLAKSGLRYNRFHTTALCSPSRAALLTGRNHHSVGTGVIIEMGTGYPGYTGMVPKTAAGLPQVLQMNGYATAAIGKWHNTPEWETSPVGPLSIRSNRRGKESHRLKQRRQPWQISKTRSISFSSAASSQNQGFCQSSG